MGSGAPAAFFPLKIQADLRGTTKKKENKFGSSPHFYIGKSPECLKPPGFWCGKPETRKKRIGHQSVLLSIFAFPHWLIFILRISDMIRSGLGTVQKSDGKVPNYPLIRFCRQAQAGFITGGKVGRVVVPSSWILDPAIYVICFTKFCSTCPREAWGSIN